MRQKDVVRGYIRLQAWLLLEPSCWATDSPLPHEDAVGGAGKCCSWQPQLSQDSKNHVPDLRVWILNSVYSLSYYLSILGETPSMNCVETMSDVRTVTLTSRSNPQNPRDVPRTQVAAPELLEGTKSTEAHIPPVYSMEFAYNLHTSSSTLFTVQSLCASLSCYVHSGKSLGSDEQISLVCIQNRCISFHIFSVQFGWLYPQLRNSRAQRADCNYLRFKSPCVGNLLYSLR